MASPTYIAAGSSVILTHTDDILAGSPHVDTVTIAGASVPASPPALPFQLNNTFTAGTSPTTSSTTAQASAYTITSLSEMSLGLLTGTGVIQTNVPGHFYTGASDLDINVNLNWTIGTAGFPAAGHPPAITYQFSLGGIVGQGGSDEFKVNLKFFTTSAGIQQVGSVNIDQPFRTAGAFTDLVSGSSVLNAGMPIAAGTNLQLSGTIDFLATNDEGPSNIDIVNQDGGFSAVDSDTLPEPGATLLALCAGVWLLSHRKNSAL